MSALALATWLACAASAGAQSTPDTPAPPSAPDKPAAVAPVLASVLAPAAGADSLPVLLARAVPNDPQVSVAELLYRATNDRRRQARSRLLPNAALTLNAGSSDVTEMGVLGSSDLTRRSETATAALRWNLYNGGNDAAELRAAGRDLDAAEQDLRRAREESAERIANAYIELLRIDDLLPQARTRLQSVHRLVGLVKQQNDGGKVSDAELQQARAYQIDAEIALDQLQSERAAARQSLSRLAGEEVLGVQPLVLPAPPGGDVGSNAMQAAAQMRAAAARERVRPVASVYAPRVDLEVRQTLSDNTRPQASSRERQAWGVVARWDMPLGGELHARRDEAQRRAEASEAEADRIGRANRAELDGLLPRLDGAERSVARLGTQLDQYRALIRAGELQFEAGRRSLSQLIQLHDSLYNAEQNRSNQANRVLTTQLRRLALTGNLLPTLLQRP